MHMMSISYLAADIVSSGNWFTVLKVLMLDIARSIMFLNLRNFGLGLSSVADFLNTRFRAPTLAECAPCLPAQRAMQLGHTL